MHTESILPSTGFGGANAKIGATPDRTKTPAEFDLTWRGGEFCGAVNAMQDGTIPSHLRLLSVVPRPGTEPTSPGHSLSKLYHFVTGTPAVLAHDRATAVG